MKALVKKYYQEFVEEINFPTVIYFYETGKVIAYNAQALEMIGKPVVSVNKLRAANPSLVVTDEMLDNRSSIFYNQRFCAENDENIEIDFEINSIPVQDRHIIVIFFEYSYKQAFLHGYRKLLPRAVWMNKQNLIMGSNETFRNDQGYCESMEMPKKMDELLDEQTTTHMVEECHRLLNSKKPVFNMLQLVQPYQARSYFCKMNCVPIYNKNDTVVGLLTVYELVFNREEYEQFFGASLRENNILNQMICKTNTIIVSWMKDITYHIQYVSSNVSNLGYTCEECYSGKVTFGDMMSIVAQKAFFHHIHEIERGPKDNFNQRMQLRKADGSLVWVNIYVGVNKRNNRNYFYECFIQELSNEYSYDVASKSNIFYIALPSIKKEIEDALTSKIEDFGTYYQPIYELETGEVFALEAMLRLKGKLNGVMDPVELLTPAEYMAMSVPLGEVLLNNVARDIHKIKRCRKQPLKFFIELAMLQLIQPNYIKKVRRLFSENGVEPGDIIIGMKESILIENERIMIELIKEYKAAGFQVALTNFRGGDFRLGRLKHLGVLYVKYDKDVMLEYYKEQISSYRLGREIELVSEEEMHVMIDGVETKKQFEFLDNNKIYAYQGNYMSVPLSFENICKQMKK